MIYVMTDNKKVINVDGETGRDKKLAQGYRLLTAEEMSAAGMVGLERYVGPQNTTIKDGVITFAYTPVPVPVPDLLKPSESKSISPRQARLALLGAGLLATVENALASLPGDAGQAAKITWEYATEVKRDDPVLQQLTAALGMTDEQVDQLFIQGAKL